MNRFPKQNADDPFIEADKRGSIRTSENDSERDGVETTVRDTSEPKKQKTNRRREKFGTFTEKTGRELREPSLD